MRVIAGTRHKWFKRSVIVILYFIILSLVLPASMPVKAENSRVIRVGYPMQRGMTECDAEGNYSGYTYDYLQMVAQYTGYEFEYVTVSGDVNEQLIKMLEMLESGEIDLLGGLSYSEGMTEIFDYVVNSYGTYERGLYVLEENMSFSSTSLYSAESIRVAIFGNASSKSTEILQTYTDGIGVKLEPVFVTSTSEQVEALKKGEADALLANNLSIPMDGLCCICRFDEQPIYFATSKGNTELRRRMNEAIANINNTDPYYTTSLTQKYFYNSMQDATLTEEEQEYLAQFDTFHIMALGEKAPLIYKDSDGNAAGVAVSLLEYMAKDSKVNVEIEVIEELDTFMTAVSEGQPDLVLCGGEMPWIADTENYWTTMSYMSAPLSLVVNKNVDRTKLMTLREAKVGGTLDETDVFTGTAKECLFAINKGAADYAYINPHTVEYYKNNLELNNIYVYQDIDKEDIDFYIGLNKRFDQKMLLIINKSINNIPQEELINSYLYENTQQMPEINIWEYISRHKAETLCVLIFMVSGLMLFGMYLRYLEERKHKKIILEQSRLEGLTGLYTGTAFQMFVAEKLAAHTDRRQLFIMIDVDKFKQVNDSYGHLYGDYIIKTIASLEKEIFGSGALIGRAGGDEFILFSDEDAVIDAIEENCHLLQERLGAVEAPDKARRFSLSIGGVITTGAKDYDEIFKKADTIMYQVKGQGGGGFQIEEDTESEAETCE